MLRKTVREAKKVYYNRVFLQYKEIFFLTWSVIKQTLNKNTQHNDLPAMFVHNDMIIDFLMILQTVSMNILLTLALNWQNLLQLMTISIIIYKIHITMLL